MYECQKSKHDRGLKLHGTLKIASEALFRMNRKHYIRWESPQKEKLRIKKKNIQNIPNKKYIYVVKVTGDRKFNFKIYLEEQLLFIF